MIKERPFKCWIRISCMTIKGIEGKEQDQKEEHGSAQKRKKKGPSLPGVLNIQKNVQLIGQKRMVQHQEEDVCNNADDKLRKKAKGMAV